MATGTLSPAPKFYGWDPVTGAPLAGGLLYTYVAGTTTPVTTYNAVTLAPGTENANPIELNSAGYCVIFLTPGVSYKYILKTAAGVTVWSQDNISAVPTASPAVDVTGTAGESIAAEAVVYLSDGSGGKSAGQWYNADSDLAYSSSLATEVGIALAAISSGSQGSIRLSGQMTIALTSLTPGADYYVSATAGSMTVTPPANIRFVGRADGANSIVMSPNPIAIATVNNTVCQGRLTLTTGVPVTVADVTAATTLFFAPYAGNLIALYNGTSWALYTFPQLSIAIPATTSQMYDVFVYDNAGTRTLELLAWTNDTTRATALVTQDGVLCKTGVLTRRYVGSVRTTGVSGQTEDSTAKRQLWNYYNQKRRLARVLEATATWSYGTNTYRQANAAVANQLAIVVGVPENPLFIEVQAAASSATGGDKVYVAIGQDSTTTPTASNVGIGNADNNNAAVQLRAHLDIIPSAGYHTYVWLEKANTAGATTWYGTTDVQSGIYGWVEG